MDDDQKSRVPVAEAKKVGRRRTWLVLCVGVILGFAGASAGGPAFVSALFKPLQGPLMCAPTVKDALTQFLELQLICAGLGGVTALVALFFWRRFLRKRAVATSARPTARV